MFWTKTLNARKAPDVDRVLAFEIVIFFDVAGSEVFVDLGSDGSTDSRELVQCFDSAFFPRRFYVVAESVYGFTCEFIDLRTERMSFDRMPIRKLQEHS